MTLSDLHNEFLIEFRRMKGLWGLPGLSVTPVWLCDQFVITAEPHNDNLVSLDNNEAQQQQSWKAELSENKFLSHQVDSKRATCPLRFRIVSERRVFGSDKT